jgi:hypothetical protein
MTPAPLSPTPIPTPTMPPVLIIIIALLLLVKKDTAVSTLMDEKNQDTTVDFEPPPKTGPHSFLASPTMTPLVNNTATKF